MATSTLLLKQIKEGFIENIGAKSHLRFTSYETSDPLMQLESITNLSVCLINGERHEK